MSYKATGWVWDNATQTGSERLTLLALADVCNHEGECYPGVKRIADMVGVTHRRMQQILRKLETEKHLEIKYESGTKTKTGNTNLYRMLGYISSLENEGVQSTTPHGVQSTTPELSVELSVKEKDSAPPDGDARLTLSDTLIHKWQYALDEMVKFPDTEFHYKTEKAIHYLFLLLEAGKIHFENEAEWVLATVKRNLITPPIAEQQALDALQRGETVYEFDEFLQPIAPPALSPIIKPDTPPIPDDVRERFEAVAADATPTTAQTAPVEPDEPEEKPKKERSEKQKANDKLVEALGKAYGVESSNGEFANYLRIAKQLLKDMTVDEFPAYVEFVRKYASENGGWTVTLNSLISGKVNPVSLYLARDKAQTPAPASYTPPILPEDLPYAQTVTPEQHAKNMAGQKAAKAKYERIREEREKNNPKPPNPPVHGAFEPIEPYRKDDK